MTEEEKERKAKIEAYAELIERGVKQRSLLSTMELDTEDAKRQMGQRLMDEKLAALATENGRGRPCPKCGKTVPVRSKNVQRTFKSLSGTHTFSRNYHYCERCKSGFYPRDE